MDKQPSRVAPRAVVEALDASVDDIATGRMHDAQAVQEQAVRLLSAHDAARAAAPSLRRAQPGRQAEATFDHPMIEQRRARL